MNLESVGAIAAGSLRFNESGQQIDMKRQASQETPPSSSEEENKAQPEELLNQIKALTEDGLYSVRFERDKNSEEVVVKVVDQNTDEVIRQIPPEELLKLTQHLAELTGNIVDTKG